MSQFQQQLIGTKEAAAILGESIKNTTRRVDAGELVPVRKLPGLRGAYIFDQADVENIKAGLELAAAGGTE